MNLAKYVAVAVAGLLGVAFCRAVDEPLCAVTIRARVPANAPTVYLTGNRPEMGDWNPAFFPMSGTGGDRVAALHLPRGAALEFKVTLGSWDREGLGPGGATLPNFRLAVDADTNITVEISDFKKGIGQYLADPQGSGVAGRLIYWTNVASKFLVEPRHVEIWLPPGYDESPTNRYDVLYMHDGQNLFDPRIAFGGVDWGVDQAIVRCVRAGIIKPVIVVGVWNSALRLREYSPWDLGTNYARFLIEELMPRVNQTFRTQAGPAHTAVMGSSMGGLISFWLAWKHPDVFSSAGCLSTSFPWTGHVPSVGAPLIEREIAANASVPRGVRFYFDYGTGRIDRECAPEQGRVAAWLAAQGLKEGADFVVRVFPGADHNESAWRARLDEPLVFLFGE